MKQTLSLLAAWFALFSFSNAQDVKINAFSQETASDLSTSAEAGKKIDFAFPLAAKNSSFPSPQTSKYVRPDSKIRRNRYLKSAFGLGALTGAAAGAAVSEITNSPKEWHRTTGGFARRFASSYAQGAISKTITYGMNETFKLDDHFEKSGQKKFSLRLKHALLGSFATRTEKGKYVPDIPFFVGTYSANIIAKETWFPKRFTYKDGLKGGSISILTRLGMNLVKEFLRK